MLEKKSSRLHQMKKHLEENHRLPLALLLLLAIITLLASFYAGSRTAGVFTFSPRAAFEGPFMGESLGNPPGTPDLIGENDTSVSQKYCMRCNSEKGYCEPKKVAETVTCMYTTSLTDRIVCNAACVKDHISAISGFGNGQADNPPCLKECFEKDDPQKLSDDACDFPTSCGGCPKCKDPPENNTTWCVECVKDNDNKPYCSLSAEKPPCNAEGVFDSCKDAGCEPKSFSSPCFTCVENTCVQRGIERPSNLTCSEFDSEKYFDDSLCGGKCPPGEDPDNTPPVDGNIPGCPGPNCNNCRCGTNYTKDSGCGKFCGEGAVCPGPTCDRCPCDDPSKIGPGSGGCWEWCGRDPKNPNGEPKPCTGDNCRCPGPNCDRVCAGDPTHCGCPNGTCP